ncbi:hypothetical protein [Scytonema sp. NUACC21]
MLGFVSETNQSLIMLGFVPEMYCIMGNHQIRKEKWEIIQENLEKSSELLSEVQLLTEELREDYSYSSAASERQEKLDELYSDLEEALETLEKALGLLNGY